MSTLAVEIHPLAQDVHFTDDIIVSFVDARRLTVPLIWFPRLTNTGKEQLEYFEILGDGEGIHWPQIDEDISVAGSLAGAH